MNDRDEQGRGRPVRAPGWTARWLRIAGCARVDEVLGDLEEEAGRLADRRGDARVPGAWWLRQLLGVVAYEWRDRLVRPRRRPIAPIASTRDLHWALSLRLALRGLRRAPATPLFAALTLAVGFGAAAAIYGVYTGFDRSLPVPDGDEVRRIRVLDERGRAVEMRRSDLTALRDGTRSFERIGAFATRGATLRAGDRGAIHAQGAAMTPAAFELLRMAPHRGRLPQDGDVDAVVLGYRLWTDYLGGGEEGLGGSVRIDGIEHVVVGVMPEGHRFPFNQDFWTLLPRDHEGGVETIARLIPEATAARAEAEVAAVLEGLRQEEAAAEPAVRVEVIGFTAKRGEGGEMAILATVLALVVALVLVSCSNVSNLLLARAVARTDALAVHAALGAGPRQVILQTLIDALLISLGGALAGCVIGAAGIRYIESTLSGHWGYYWMAVRFDPGVALFIFALAVVAGLVAGTLPAVRLRRTDLGALLRADASSIAGGRRGLLSSTMLNLQVALSCFALIVAMLLTSALLRSRVDADFPAADIGIANLSLEADVYDDVGLRRDFLRGFGFDAASDARVAALAFSTGLPGVNAQTSTVEIEGVTVDPQARPRVTPVLTVSRSYFDLFAIEGVAGEIFDDDVDMQADIPLVVSESFVAGHLDAADPVGLRLRLPRVIADGWFRIIGVVEDLEVYESEDPRARARAYVPYAAVVPRSLYVLHRAGAAGFDSSGSAVRALIAARDPDVAVTGAFDQDVHATVADVLAYVRRLFQTAGLLASLGGAGAAVVALIGLYGALSFEVQRRRTEVGVRMALGASRRDVVAHTARRGLLRVAPGLLLGLVMSAGISPLLGVLLGRTDPRDPLIYLGVYGAFVATAILATVLPGRRAARLDPVDVLRDR